MNNRQLLGEVVYTALYTILKAANVSVGVDKMEVIRREADRLAKRIENEIKLSVIEKIDKLQDAMIPAFEVIEKRLDAIPPKPVGPPNDIVVKGGGILEHDGK